jgi:single-strand DNA-binding protein
MSSFNRVIIAGNLTRNPEFKQFNNNSVCKLGLASNRQYKNRSTGDMVQEVCYVDIDVWGPQAESCNKYLEKGRAVLIEGRLKFDSWKDNEGQTRSKHTIVADRVVFLYNQSDSLAEDNSNEVKLDKDLEDQLNKIKKSKAKDKVEKIVASKVIQSENKSDSNDVPDIEFQDEPPFQDDLPF